MVHRAASLANLDLATLSERLGKRCREKGVSVTTAESCTGGGVARVITAVAGSSDYFETGYVTYSNAAKTRLLGVSESLLAEHGAVSREVEIGRASCRGRGWRGGGGGRVKKDDGRGMEREK